MENRMLKPAEMADIFHQTGAFLEGHFQLSSGLHSPNYMQCARVLQHPQHCERFCKALAEKVAKFEPTVVLAPAIGAVLVGYELARALGCRSVFAERVNGVMCIRRGQEIKSTDRVLLTEDVVTTGKSIRETEVLARQVGAEVLAMCCIVDRSGGKWDHPLKLVSLLSMELVTYTPESCPLCAQGLSLEKPGSRFSA